MSLNISFLKDHFSEPSRGYPFGPLFLLILLRVCACFFLVFLVLVLCKTALRRTALTRTAQIFALVSLFRPKFSLFSFSLWGLPVDLWPWFEAVDHPNCAFGLPGVIV